MRCSNSVKKFLSNYLSTSHWNAFTKLYTIEKLPRGNICEAASDTRLKQLLAVEKNIYAQAKLIKSPNVRF